MNEIKQIWLHLR